MVSFDGTTFLPWLVLVLLSLTLAGLRLHRTRTWRGVGPSVTDLVRPPGLSHRTPTPHAAAQYPASGEQALRSFELALGRLCPVSTGDRAAAVVGLGGRSHIEHDHRLTSPMAMLFADLFELGVPLELEHAGRTWTVKIEDFPEQETVAIRVSNAGSPGSHPRLGVPVALHIRAAGTSLEGLTEVFQDPGGGLLLALPQTLYRFERRSWSRATALEGITAKLAFADGCGVATSQVVDLSRAGLLVRISDPRAHLMEGWGLTCTLELLGRTYSSLKCEVRHFDAKTGLAGLRAEERPGAGALERLCGLIEVD